jgi:hypothetical protein
VPAPSSNLLAQFETRGDVILVGRHQFVYGAIVLLTPPLLKVRLRLVSTSDDTPRRIALDAYDCLIVAGHMAGPSIDDGIEYWWNAPWELGFSMVGPRAALAISHKHWVRYHVPGGGLIERMSWRSPMSNDAVEIERLDPGTYRLHMCEDVYVKGKRYIQLDALVLDVSLHDGEEVDPLTLRAKDRKRKVRSRTWPPDDYPGLMKFE